MTFQNRLTQKLVQARKCFLAGRQRPAERVYLPGREVRAVRASRCFWESIDGRPAEVRMPG